jgi:[acyl-carrier-protein] S-malonyltransferase
MDEKLSFIYPAFVTEFLGTEVDTLVQSGEDIHGLLIKSSDICEVELSDFNIHDNPMLGDEVKNQYITYIFSCAVSSFLKKRGIKPVSSAGYSMGIYAALENADCISFEDGLRLICQAYQFIRESLAPGTYTMGVTGGLEEDDVKELLLKYAPGTRIINSNSPFSYVFSGPKVEIELLITAARDEGALQARVMGVTVPYHSHHLDLAAFGFRNFVESLTISAPSTNIISSVTQKDIVSVSDVRNELVNNLNHSFNWFKTINCLLKKGASTFIECGAGDSLTRIAKFIEGDFKTINLKNISQFL